MTLNHANSSDAVFKEDDANHFLLLREKSAHITKAARSATLANILAPLLCIPMFKDEVPFSNLALWLGYMFVVVSIRTWMIYHPNLDDLSAGLRNRQNSQSRT